MATQAPGLDAIYKACRNIYPNQLNPLQIAALVKYWLGGPDPLDFINVYSSEGDPDNGVPVHWHYVSCGLSDLYGDGRVHEMASAGQPSGFGFELTFRLQRGDGETMPPTWPAELLQALARYVFNSENMLCCGDHVSWNTPLDGGDSRLQHMLLTQDPQLKTISLSLGGVMFIQVVGVTAEELQAAQQWNAAGVVELLRRRSLTGGKWLVTNMRRGESLFDIDPDTHSHLQEGISREGSSLSGVSAVCSWEDEHGRRGGGAVMGDLPSLLPVVGGTTRQDGVGGVEVELLRTTTLEKVHLTFNLESGRLILLALRGRLKHGRHFTFKSFTGDVAVTLVCPGIQGSFADEQHPLAAQGPWLQMYLSYEHIDTLLTDLSVLDNKVDLPITFTWPALNTSVTVHHNL